MHRDKHTLVDGFADLTKLYRYLYGTPEATVRFENAIHVPMELTMTDDMSLMVRNLNSPEFKPALFTPLNHLGTMMAIIEQLKEQPAQTDSFKSRWDEIATHAAILMTCNVH